MPNDSSLLMTLGGLIFLLGFVAGGALVFWMWNRSNAD